MERNEKLVEIFENEQYQQEVQNVHTAEELQKLLANYGLEMSIEEIEEFSHEAVVCMQQDELSEEDLENVAGGKSKKRTKKTGKKAAKTAARITLAIATGGVSEYWRLCAKNAYDEARYGF